jgi:hypothetical protein
LFRFTSTVNDGLARYRTLSSRLIVFESCSKELQLDCG